MHYCASAVPIPALSSELQLLALAHARTKEAHMALPVVPRTKPIHALFFPFPAIGHINPLLQLASSLCSGYGVKVTFLMTEYRRSQLEEKECKQQLQEDDPLLSFYSIPDGLSSTEDYEGVVNAPKLFEAMLKMAGNGVLEAVMTDLHGRGTPVDCIVSDTLLSWAQFVADKHDIPRMSFWISSASAYLIHHYTPQLIAQGDLPLSESNGRQAMVEIPGICTLPVDTLPSQLQVSDTSDIMFTAFNRLFEEDQKCGMLIINSHEDLEGEQLKVLQEDFNSVVYVGPLLPSNLVPGKPSFHGKDNRIQLSTEKHNACFEWLDSKPTSSVLYVSFGSIAALGKEELHQLALGLESSKQNLLWVIRGFNPLDDADLPEGFFERMKERCLIVGWTLQPKVLAHPSVAAFLTQCGWNSIMESLSFGVPLITMPSDFAEQRANAWFSEHMWKVGLPLKLGNNGSLCPDEIAISVKTVMEGDDGAIYRNNAKKFSESLKKAICPGGLCEDNLRLVAHFMSMSPRPSQ